MNKELFIEIDGEFDGQITILALKIISSSEFSMYILLDNDLSYFDSDFDVNGPISEFFKLLNLCGINFYTSLSDNLINIETDLFFIKKNNGRYYESNSIISNIQISKNINTSKIRIFSKKRPTTNYIEFIQENFISNIDVSFTDLIEIIKSHNGDIEINQD